MSQVLHQLRETAQASYGRVDRANGVIYRVRVQGTSSRNTHDEPNVSGTVYLPEALQAAIPLYEGAKVNVDHLAPTDRQGYSSEDRLGKLVNVRFEEGALWADLHILLAHPIAEKLLEAAEKMPDALALSHNAQGRTEVRGGKLVVVEIKEVRSVDVVADGGGNKSLFESLKMSNQTTLRKIVQRMAAGRRARYRKLVEAMGDQPMEDAGEEAGWENHLCNMAAAIFGDDSLSPDAKKKKLMAALKMSESDDAEKEAKDTEESEEDDGPAKKKKEDDVEEAQEQVLPAGTGLGPKSAGAHWDKPKRSQTDTKVTGESRKRKVDPQLQELLEWKAHAELKEWIRTRCDAKHVPCDKRLLESLIALKSHDLIDDHLDLLASYGVQAPKSRSSTPRSSSPYRPLQESATPAKSADEFASLLLS